MKLALFLACFIALLLCSGAYAQQEWIADCQTIRVESLKTSPTYFLSLSNTNFNELVFTMTHPDASFDPDLFVRWGDLPSTSDYDYADFSAKSPVNLVVNPSDTEKGAKRLYFNIYSAAGTGDAELCVAKYKCANKNCGAAAGAGTCEATTGTCTCNAGFSGASCEVETRDADLNTEINASLEASKTIGFKFTVPQNPPAGSLRFVLRKTDLYGVVMRAKRSKLPTYDDFDVEVQSVSYQYTAQLTVDTKKYLPGDWYITLSSTYRYASKFDIKMGGSFLFCPNNCSDNGVCDEETSVCTCNKGYEALEDCSLYAEHLTIGSKLDMSVAPFGHSSFHFKIQKQTVDNNVEVALKWANTETCGQTCPRVYIAHGSSNTGQATPNHFISASPSPAPQSHGVSITDHDLQVGTYSGAIYNPSFTKQTGVLSIVQIAHCPNSCSGNGVCTENGNCVCNPGFYSSDCGVSSATCRAKFDTKDTGSGSTFVGIVLVIALILGAIVGIFIFKHYANKRSTAQPTQQQNVNAAYAQLN